MPSYIVPRTSYALGRAALRYAPYYRGVKYMAARAAINNAPRIYRGTKRAARVIQRAYRRRRSKRRRVEGAVKVNKQNSAWVFGQPNVNQAMQRKTLYAVPIRFCNPPGNNDGIREAPGMVFHVSGFKMCLTMRNIGELPIHVHMAIVQPKEINATISDLKQDTFVESQYQTVRYTDFLEYSTDTQWDRRQDCNPLNRKKFNIFTHKKFILANIKNLANTASTDDENPNKANYLHFERYYKLNKKFEFESDTSNTVMKPLWVMMWFETLFPSSAVESILSVNCNVKSYIKSTAQCC